MPLSERRSISQYSVDQEGKKRGSSISTSGGTKKSLFFFLYNAEEQQGKQLDPKTSPLHPVISFPFGPNKGFRLNRLSLDLLHY